MPNILKERKSTDDEEDYGDHAIFVKYTDCKSKHLYLEIRERIWYQIFEADWKRTVLKIE